MAEKPPFAERSCRRSVALTSNTVRNRTAVVPAADIFGVHFSWKAQGAAGP